MKTTTERLEGSRVALDIEVEAEQINKAMDKVYRRLVNQVNVPGFRRGKAPRYMVERVVGREVMMDEAMHDLMPAALKQGLDSEPNLRPVGEPEAEMKSLDPFVIRVILEVMPDIQLPADYRDIRVDAPDTSITDTQIERVIKQLVGEATEWSFPAEERAARMGDRAHVDVQGFTAQGPLSVQVQHDVLDLIPAEEGGDVLPDLLAGVVGMKPGDEKDIVTTFPDDYGNEELRGADVTFHIKLVELQEGTRPELSAIAVKQGLANEAAMRENIRTELVARRETQGREAHLDQILEKMMASADFPVPSSMVREELDERMKRLEAQLKEQKINLNQYLQYTGKTRKELEDDMRPDIERQSRVAMLVERLAEVEGIEVDDAEIEAELDTLIDSTTKSVIADSKAQTAALANPDLSDDDVTADTEDAEQSESEATEAAAPGEVATLPADFTPDPSTQDAMPAASEEATSEEAASDDTAPTAQSNDLLNNAIRSMVRQQFDTEETRDRLRSRLLNRKIEDRIIAIASGTAPELPAASLSSDSDEASLAETQDTTATADAQTPDQLAEAQQTAGGESDGATRQAPAASSDDEQLDENAPTSGQTDRAEKIANDL